MSDSTPSRKIIQDNLNALMAARPDLGNNTKLAERAKVGTGSISRLRNAGQGASAEMIDALAGAFEIQPWQLLVPGLDPRNLPVMQPMTASERDLYEKLKQVIEERNMASQ